MTHTTTPPANAPDHREPDHREPDVTDAVTVTAASRHRTWGALLLVSILLVSAGLACVTASVFAPTTVDKITGDLKIAVQKHTSQILTPNELPRIRLGAEGGIRDLDRCDGTFTEMTRYRTNNIPPLYAAHNNCGGDIILGWNIGQHLTIEGTDTIYEVIEERHTPKWSNADLLTGMTGELILQTCYYGENKMRFLALAPLKTQPTHTN